MEAENYYYTLPVFSLFSNCHYYYDYDYDYYYYSHETNDDDDDDEDGDGFSNTVPFNTTLKGESLLDHVCEPHRTFF